MYKKKFALESLFNKFEGLEPATLFEKRLQHSYNTFSAEHLRPTPLTLKFDPRYPRYLADLHKEPLWVHY